MLKGGKEDAEGGPWLITVDNTIIVEHLNRALAEIDGSLDKVAKHGKSVSTYEVARSSYDKLSERFGGGAKPPSGSQRKR